MFRAKAREGRKLNQKSLTNVKRKTQQLGGSWARKPPWPGAGMSGSEPSQSNIPMLLSICCSSKCQGVVLVLLTLPSQVHVACVVNWDIKERLTHCCNGL